MIQALRWYRKQDHQGHNIYCHNDVINHICCEFDLADVWWWQLCWWQWNRKLLMIICSCRWTATTTRQCSPTASPASCCPSSWTVSHSASSSPFIPRLQTGWTMFFFEGDKTFKINMLVLFYIPCNFFSLGVSQWLVHHFAFIKWSFYNGVNACFSTKPNTSH